MSRLFLYLLTSLFCGVLCAAEEDRELLQFFDMLYETTPEDVPERFYVNVSVSPEAFQYRRVLKGSYKAGETETAAARRELCAIRDRILEGRRWPHKEREEFFIPFVRTVPAFGKAWQEGVTIQNEFALSSTEEIPSGIQWRIFYDTSGINIQAEVPDSDLKSLPYDGATGRFPWLADCIEVFILPDWDLKLYWEIVINPANDLFCGMHCNDTRGKFVYRIQKKMDRLQFFTQKYDDGYQVQMHIPFAALPNYMRGNQPESGSAFYFALIRIDDGVPLSARPLLYDGHNIFGYFRGVLSPQQ